MFSPDARRPTALLPIGIEAVRFDLSYMRKPGGVMVWRSVCALMPFGVWLLMGVKVARLVGDGVAVGVRPDDVRFVVAHCVRLLRSGRGCGGRCGVSAHGIEVAQIVSWVRPAYQGIKYDIYIMC